MLIIRFQRVGKRNAPQFRLVIAEKTAPPKGRVLEVLGSLNRRQKTHTVNSSRVCYWISQGAKVSPSAHNFLVKKGIVKGKKIPVKIRKKPVSKDVKTPEKPPEVK